MGRAHAHVASVLVRIDEENFLVIENRATKWTRWKSRKMEKPRAAPQGFEVLRFEFGLRAGAEGGEARQEARYPNNFRHSSLKNLSKTGM